MVYFAGLGAETNSFSAIASMEATLCSVEFRSSLDALGRHEIELPPRRWFPDRGRNDRCRRARIDPR
jgi:hypothetical protein